MPHLRQNNARNRSKFRAGALLSPQQRCEAAFKLIKPPPGLAAKCKAEVMACVQSIEEWRAKEERWLKGQKQKPLRAYRDKLRAAEIAGAKLAGTFFDDNAFVLKTIKDEREFIEWCLEGFKSPRRHGGTYQSASMASAADYAWRILKLYGHNPPALTEDAIWHQLAATLFGTEVDLVYIDDTTTKPKVRSFSFDYLKHVWGQLHKGGTGLLKKEKSS